MHTHQASGKRGIFSRIFGGTSDGRRDKKNSEISSSLSKGASVPSWYASMQAYISQPSGPKWSGRSYTKFAEEAYRKNVIAHRSISMIARGASSLKIKLHQEKSYNAFGVEEEPTEEQKEARDKIRRLIARPTPLQSTSAFFEYLYSQLLISGNVYIHAVTPANSTPHELHLLRPDRVEIIAGRGGVPSGYIYRVDKQEYHHPVDPISGLSKVLHIKMFNPMDDWYGLSPVEAAAYSIDQHNQAAAWNQSLLQNGARPSGALIVKANGESNNGSLSEEQYFRIKGQIDEQFSGANNAGRPILLEGGLEWREMSLSPKDMDFLECKNSSARDIALAFGVPPQLLGIPGDNTYSNLAEARLALWEQTILPMANHVLESLGAWLLPMFGEEGKLIYDENEIAALSPKRDKVWDRIKDADFLSDEEKREMVNIGINGI